MSAVRCSYKIIDDIVSLLKDDLHFIQMMKKEYDATELGRELIKKNIDVLNARYSVDDQEKEENSKYMNSYTFKGSSRAKDQKIYSLMCYMYQCSEVETVNDKEYQIINNALDFALRAWFMDNCSDKGYKWGE